MFVPILQLLVAAVAGPVNTRSDTVTVFAASDLSAAFAELVPAFQEAERVLVRVVFGSTGHLALQVRHGAPADAIFAANVSYIDQLRSEGLTFPGTEKRYARGRIVLAVKNSSDLRVERVDQLVQSGVKKVALANPDHAPYGLAGKQALASAGIWDRVRPRLVYAENIRQTLQFLQSGAVDAAIIALSIAKVPDIRYTVIPDHLHQPIIQAAAVIKASKRPGPAKTFIEFVLGPTGQQILGRYGFVAPE